MSTFVTLIMVISGLLFIGSVMLMSPKGGLGLGIGGIQSSNEYGSKKSIEHKLKRVATVSVIIFGLSCLILPYVS